MKRQAIYTLLQRAGLIQAGDVDLNRRPIVKNPDGSISTVRSISVTDPQGQATLIPTVLANPVPHVASNKEAIDYYQRTGHNLGTFKNEDLANAYAQLLHQQQARRYK